MNSFMLKCFCVFYFGDAGIWIFSVPGNATDNRSEYHYNLIEKIIGMGKFGQLLKMTELFAQQEILLVGKI